MQAAPLAALIPLLIMAYGIGLTSKVFVVCIMAMPVIVLNTSVAVKNTPSSVKEMARSFLWSRKDVILKIIIPSASPVIFAGLRLGVSAGFIGAILAELKITPTGVGDIISYSRMTADYPSMYAAIFSIILLAVIFLNILEKIEDVLFKGNNQGYISWSIKRRLKDMSNDQIENAVTVKNVYKNYGDVEALRDLSLEFPKGQLTSLLGPSGCGKTTLLKIIAGLLPATQGEVLVNGQPVNKPGPDRAFVFQDFALMPWASVIRNVAFGLELRGVNKSERESIATKYIKDVGLTGFEHSFPHELSGGMRQRVGLARALSVDSPVLLKDEPFSAVDEQTRRKFQEDLLNLVKNENKTFIFVTHSIEEAVYVSDQVALLLPRPSRVSEIIKPSSFKNKDINSIRKDSEYLDTVERIWKSLRSYVE